MKSGGLRTTVSSAVTKYKGCVYVILHRTRGGKLTSYERNTEIERERKNKEERNTVLSYLKTTKKPTLKGHSSIFCSSIFSSCWKRGGYEKK